MQRKIGRPGIAALLLCLMMTALLPAAALAENSDSVIPANTMANCTPSR